MTPRCDRCCDEVPADHKARVDPFLKEVYGTEETVFVCDECYAEIEKSARKARARKGA